MSRRDESVGEEEDEGMDEDQYTVVFTSYYTHSRTITNIYGYVDNGVV